MAKSRRDLVNHWRHEAAQYDSLHLAYLEKEKHDRVPMIKRSKHFDKLAEMAGSHAQQLSLATS